MKKWIIRLFVSTLILGLVSCATFGPDQCQALVDVAEELVVEITHEELSKEEKAAKAERYTKIAARIAGLGCVFVPPPGAPES